MQLDNKSVLIATHFFVTGPPQELATYLQDKVRCLGLVSHPFPYARRINSTATLYEEGHVTRQWVAPALKGPGVIHYIKDFLLGLAFALRFRHKFDLYIGADNLNALVGLVLKRLGVVRVVVYYTVDYVPQRFSNPILNKIYHRIDKLCCHYSDVAWNLTAEMAAAREARGVSPTKSAPQLVVPGGNNFHRASVPPRDKISRHRLVYLGHLREFQGVDFLIQAMPALLRQVPEASLVIIGTGPMEGALKALVRRLGLESKVTFTGYIEEHAEVERLLAACAIGVAPYVPDTRSFSYFASPGKAKAYTAAGLPVVIVRVPPIAREIEEWGAGIAIDYNQGQLVAALVKLLEDDDFHARCRERAIAYAANFTWERVFDQAFRETALLSRRPQHHGSSI